MPSSTEPFPVENLEDLLSETLGTCQIKSVEWKPLTGPGENFGSLILAINVTVADKNGTRVYNVVSKLPPRLDYLLELFNSPVTFKKELLFYKNILPELLDLQRESGVAEADLATICPRYYGGRLGTRNRNEFDLQAAIVLENLKYSGYGTEDRLQGLDRRHSMFAVRQLARMHGITVALKLKKPAVFQGKLMPVLREVVSETALNCIRDMVRTTLQDLRGLELDQKLMERAERTIVRGMERYAKPGDVEEPWGTLIHNDFWVNNMMYRHDDDGEILDMKIVDFQLCLYDYGMTDLIFFLGSSVENQTLNESMTELIDAYYEAFAGTLKSLNVDDPRFGRTEFTRHLDECAPTKFVQCMMMVQVIQATRDESKSLTATEANANGSESVFSSQSGNDLCKRKMIHLVDTFHRRGWLLE